MIINLIVAAAAAAAARAAGTLSPGGGCRMTRRPHDLRRERSTREAHPGSRHRAGSAEHAHHGPATYLRDLEEDARGQTAYVHDVEEMIAQARELEEVVAVSRAMVPEADISTQSTQKEERGRTEKSPPPPLPDTNHPAKLLGLAPGASFDEVRRAYRAMARLYHPDVVAGPGAAADARREAGWDFARINSAFDILKRAEDEGVSARARAVRVSEGVRPRDPRRASCGGSVVGSEPRQRRPSNRTWQQEESELGPGQRRTGNFECSGAGYAVDASSPGGWWTTQGLDRLDRRVVHDAPEGFGFISSNEQLREERLTLERGEVRGHGGPSITRSRAVRPQRRLQEGSSVGDEAPDDDDGKRVDTEKQNERITADATGRDWPPRVAAATHDRAPRQRFPEQGKWWKRDAATVVGFLP